MKTRMIAIVLACCTTMTAQISEYLGPGILTRGAGDIGKRGGEDVSLRFFVSANGIYDSGIQPFSTDGKGHLSKVDALYGMEATIGAYGTHNFQHSKLGLDYTGSYRHYTNNSFFDGTDHSLALGYTIQKSRRLVFDTRQTAGIVSQGTSFAAVPGLTDSVVTPSSLLFDNRVSYLQSTLDVNYRLSERTTVTGGGDGFGVWRKATGLIGMQGYNLRGSIQHRLSKRTTVGASYQHTHYDFPKAFGESDINTYTGQFATQLGPRWTVSLGAGVYTAEVQGLQQVSLDPAISALLGVSVTQETFYRKSLFPQYSASIGRQFRRASLSFHYSTGSSGGNGVYLTSRSEETGASFSYVAARRWSVSVDAGYSRLQGIGQNLKPYGQFSGGSSFSYSITHPIQFVARVDSRRQEVSGGSYLQNSYRATIGISFSPADVPLSFR